MLPAILCLSTALSAQERFGELTGTATDPSGAVLPNVNVKVTNKATARIVETKTDASGQYVVRNLDPGRYVVRFEVKGFATQEIPEVNLLLGKTLRVNAAMTVASAEQTVQITDAAPLIDTTNTTMANNITAEEFDRLPKARSFQNLAVLSTSVNSGAIEGGIQVNGASGAENNFTIDGISTTSLINGQSRQDAAFEILQEVQIKTGGISAEFGGAMGGVISAISKSGGNAFHGDVHYYLSGNSLNAAPVKRLLLSPTDQLTTKYHQDVKQKNNINEFGYTLGGYLIKNRVYFFSAASPRFGRRTNDYKFGNGVDSGSIDQKSLNNLMFEKVSFDLTKNLRGNAFFLWTPTSSTGRLPGYNGEGPNFNTGSLAAAQVNKTIGYFAPQTNYGIDLTWMANPTTLFAIKAGRFWDNYKDTGLPSPTPVNYSTSAAPSANLSFASEIPAALRAPTNFNNVPRILGSFYDVAARTYVQGDFGKFFRFLGTHDFKAGVGTQKIVNRVLTGYPTGGYINIFWDRAFNSSVPGTPRNARGKYGYYEYHEFGTGGTTGANLGNFYFQDNWRIIPRLTLNLGFRFESETVPSFQRNIQDTAFHFNWGQKFAPRLGASFDVFGDGRLKVYGSWGRYYDWVKYELARGTFGGDYWRVRYYGLDTTDVFSLSSTNRPGAPLWNPANPAAFRNRRVTGFDTIDPKIKPMGSDNINLGTEFRLGSQMVLRASYVHNSLIRTIEDLGVLVNGDEVYYYANPGEGGALITPSSGLTKPFATPKAIRKYDAAEFQLTKRYGSWFGSASYVYSRLYGNYAGLANSDEIRTGADGGGLYGAAQEAFGQNSRPGGNAGRAWDIDELLWDSKGGLNPQGRLSTDRPHAIKLYGSKTINWNTKTATDVGAFFYAASGTPLTTLVNTINGTQPFVNGRGDLGRTPFLTYTNLVIAQEFKMGETRKLRVEFNANNLFNQKTARHLWTELNRGIASAEIDLSNTDLAKGYDYNALIAKTPDNAKGLALSPLFKQADLFNPGFAGRFLLKYIF
ncbi:MAG: carboxypeptidase regulatory-like domain-containing protein [Bryobacteraceae bacterium]|nr:carboxypeptidase regulatory-like domain-containing protein [Bryobacteraceae bacterium]